jgi:hypothetical protein
VCVLCASVVLFQLFWAVCGLVLSDLLLFIQYIEEVMMRTQKEEIFATTPTQVSLASLSLETTLRFLSCMYVSTWFACVAVIERVLRLCFVFWMFGSKYMSDALDCPWRHALCEMISTCAYPQSRFLGSEEEAQDTVVLNAMRDNSSNSDVVITSPMDLLKDDDDGSVSVQSVYNEPLGQMQHP